MLAVVGTLFFLLIFTSPIIAQTKSIVKVGTKEITVSEFTDRYEFTPWNKDIRSVSIQKLKEEFLYTLIAEKLYAQKASELGYDTLFSFRTKMKALEKMYARDALYRQEILKYVKVTDDIIKQFYHKSHTKLTGRFLTTNTEAEINDLYSILKSGVSFDSLYKIRSGGDIQDTLIINFGKFDEATEEMLYKLSPGSYSKPFLYGDKWFMVLITGSIPVLPKSQREEDVIISNTKKIITTRQSKIYYEKYLDKLLADKKTDVNGKLYQQLVTVIAKIVLAKDTSRAEKIYLNESDYNEVRKELGDNLLKMPITRSGEHSSELSAFLDEMYYDDIMFTSAEPEQIKTVLSEKLVAFMRNELLTIEAFRLGLNLTSEVKGQLEIWKDNYLYSQLKYNILNSTTVNDEDLKVYYNQKNIYRSSVKVKIVEVVSDNLDDINNALNDISIGTDIKDIVLKYSKKELMRFNKGESGFIPADSLDETGRIAAGMDPGEVYGPLEIPGGYTVFKLIDKKDQTGKQTIPFEQAKESLQKSLEGLKSYHALLDYTVKLANEYGIIINDELLTSVEVTNIYSVMFRYMGFGGKILAAPLINPYTDWVKQWKEQVKENP